MVEFALILFPLLTIVAGIIWFGIGLNYWLDMQRIANQGARWAAVDCGRSASSPSGFNPCNPSLEQTLQEEALTSGLENAVCVEISFPDPSEPSGQNVDPSVGDPVKVRLEAPFTFFWIDSMQVTLGADATMRLEQDPDNFSATPAC